MKTVQRLDPHTTLEYKELNIGIVKGVGKRTQSSVTWAVVEDGKITKSDGQFEIFGSRKLAQKVADFYNK